MQCFDNQNSGLFGTVRVNFNALLKTMGSSQQTCECQDRIDAEKVHKAVAQEFVVKEKKKRRNPLLIRARP